MPTYVLYAGPDGCLLGDDPAAAAPPGYQLAGEFEAADHAAATVEGRRLVESLQARMEQQKGE